MSSIWLSILPRHTQAAVKPLMSPFDSPVVFDPLNYRCLHHLCCLAFHSQPGPFCYTNVPPVFTTSTAHNTRGFRVDFMLVSGDSPRNLTTKTTRRRAGDREIDNENIFAHNKSNSHQRTQRHVMAVSGITTDGCFV